MWRLRCEALEEQLEDATRALRATEEARRELSLDYRHVLDLAQIVSAVYSDGALCDCSMCECRRPFDEAIEHYRSKKEGEETCQ